MAPFDEIGARIVFLRDLRHFSQEGLAFECGASPSYVRRIEHGEANPTVGELLLIAGVLGAKLEILFTIPEDETVEEGQLQEQ